MKVHDFYRTNNLRVHEIPKGVKCPVTKGWPDSTKTADEVDSLLDGESINKYGWLLDDNHVVIDIDLHHESENGYESLEKLESDIGFKLEDACGAIVKSPSGGCHFYFSKPPNAKFGKVFKDRYPGIDFISGKGKQVIAAGSCHDTFPGQLYELSSNPLLLEIPYGLLRHLQALKEEKPVEYSDASEERSGDEFNRSTRGVQLILGELAGRGYAVRRCEDYYEFDRPNKTTDSKCSGHVGKLSKQGNYQLVCFSLSDSVFPSGESMTIFHAYSLLCCGGDHQRAASALYDRGFAVSDYGVDLSRLAVPVEKDGAKPAKDRRPQLTEEQLNPGGLLGEMVEFIRSTARYEHPEMTLASCLAFSGMILGRRVRAIDDTRPNLYCLSIAESGTGKNHPRQTIKRIMHEANIIPPPEGAASATGIVRNLARCPSMVVQIDEAGLVFRAMKNPRSPQAELGAQFSELFTSSNGFYAYRAYADTSNESPIDQPHLSINAVTTEQSLYTGGFTHEDIEQGLFGRFLLFRPRIMDPEERFEIEVSKVPKYIVEGVRSWWEFMPWDKVAGANLKPDHPEPMVIGISDAAKARYRSYAQSITQKMQTEDTFRKALWRRSKEKTSRLALIHACMQDGFRDGILIDKPSMDWAIAISNYSTRGMIYDMDYTMVESQYQANVQHFLGKIPPEGIDRWRLIRKLGKFRPKERDEIFTDLLSSGTILVEEMKTGGTPKTIIRIA